MMAQPGWQFQDGFGPHNASTHAHGDKFDDDLFSAALLFLDSPYGDTDSDSHSTPEPAPAQEPEVFWNSPDAEFSSFDQSCWPERPAKMPRTTASASAVKSESDAFAVKQEVVFTENVSGISALWGQEELNFRPAAPRRVNKRKEEIGVLRVQAEALQARLEVLHKQPLASHSDNGLSVDGVLAWQDVASQQLEQRKLSESENRRLKELTAEHRRVAKALKRIAARQNNSKTWDSFRPAPQHPQGVIEKSLMLDDPGIFGLLLASLDQMILQTDAMLSEITGRVLNCERHGDSHMAVKLQDSRIVPFGVAKTASAVWNYTLLNETVKQQQWSPSADGSFQSEFIAHVDIGEIRGYAEGKLVVRRVEQPGRTVIVRHSMFHCLTTPQMNRFLTVPLRHFLWIVIDRPPQLPELPGRDTISRIRTCCMSMPRLDVGDLSDPTREAAIEELQNITTQISIQQSEQCYDLVDNMLLGSPPPASGKGLPCQAAIVREQKTR